MKHFICYPIDSSQKEQDLVRVFDQLNSISYDIFDRRSKHTNELLLSDINFIKTNRYTSALTEAILKMHNYLTYGFLKEFVMAQKKHNSLELLSSLFIRLLSVVIPKKIRVLTRLLVSNRIVIRASLNFNIRMLNRFIESNECITNKFYYYQNNELEYHKYYSDYIYDSQEDDIKYLISFIKNREIIVQNHINSNNFQYNPKKTYEVTISNAYFEDCMKIIGKSRHNVIIAVNLIYDIYNFFFDLSVVKKKIKNKYNCFLVLLDGSYYIDVNKLFGYRDSINVMILHEILAMDQNNFQIPVCYFWIIYIRCIRIFTYFKKNLYL